MSEQKNQLSNEQLAIAYLKGDKNSLEILVARNLKPIFNFIRRLVNNSEVAEDLTQETFVKAWLKIKKFDQTKSFKTWLFTIAKNTAFDWLRQKKEIPLSEFTLETGENLILDNLADEELLPDELLMQKENTEFLAKKLASLPLLDKTILELYFQEDFKLIEIAEILKTSTNTIKSRYRRALVKLRIILELKD